jgi:predicted Zn-dependent protease with MMP-like domain
MDRERFEQLVSAAIESLPDEFMSKLENLDVVVQDWPTADQLHRARLGRDHSLLGLYQGIPLTKRGRHYGMVPPDKITVFRKPIEAKCGQQDDETAAEIARVIRHEIAHHFGISDARLKQLESEDDY